MSEKIEPAVSAKIWEEVASSPWPIDSYIGDTPDVCAYLVALNNHALPDSDPRKITREDVELVEYAAAGQDMKEDFDAVMAFAAKLRALLPPKVG